MTLYLMRNMKKGMKIIICILLAVLVFLPGISAYANEDYSAKKYINDYLLRQDGFYYENAFSTTTKHSSQRAIKNVIDINSSGYYVTSDNVLHYYFDGEFRTMENVVMISDVDINDFFFYLDTSGDIHHLWREYSEKTDSVVAKNVGNLKKLGLGYALSEDGDLYYLKDSDSKLVDTDVNSVKLFTDMLYMKNDNSLYLYDISEQSLKLLLKDVSFYEVFISPTSEDEYNIWQFRATTSDNTRYKWGSNTTGEIYKNNVDGNNVAPAYIDMPMKISDNTEYENNDVVLQADGNLYGKIQKKGYSFSLVLLDTNVNSIRKFTNSNKYEYQKFNDDFYRIERNNRYLDSTFKQPVLVCEDAVKGLGVFAQDYVIKKDGTVVSVISGISISPVKYFGASDWALSELKEADELGFLESVDNTIFTSRILRKDFCALVVDMCEIYKDKELTVSTTNPFKDVEDNEGMNYSAILKAYNAGIISGTSATCFDPNAEISREQMASIMYRAAKYLKPDMSFGKGLTFSDSKEFSDWSIEAINAMSGSGIIKGSNGKFNPKDYVTVEQASIMILRLFKEIS